MPPPASLRVESISEQVSPIRTVTEQNPAKKNDDNLDSLETAILTPEILQLIESEKSDKVNPNSSNVPSCDDETLKLIQYQML